MIRMAFMTDKARVIGASSMEANVARMSQLPAQLPHAMGQLYKTPNIAVGAPSLGQVIQADKHRYVITRDKSYQLPDGFSDAIICHDYQDLITQYRDGDEELLVVGGLTIFKLFLPHAQILDVAESDKLVAGDVVFSEWDDGRFAVVKMQTWEGFKILRLVRV